jgi:stearoyl-CoA desaturase (delta-9 desaturase)
VTAAAALLAPALAARLRRRVLIFNLVPAISAVAAVWLSIARGFRAADVLLLLAFTFLAGIGITVGYHRLLAHRALRAGDRTRAVLVALGCLAGQGPPIYWVANHRRHHTYSDQAGDPHSPHVRGGERLGIGAGLWHAHVGWLFGGEITNSVRFGKDLHRDPVVRGINRLYLPILLSGWIVPAVLGAWIAGDAEGALRGALFGGAARTLLTIHSGYLINSVCHRLGRRDFATKDESRNHALVAALTFGEGWHNNHHAFPRSAQFGLGLRQPDVGYWVIAALERMGLVSSVVRPRRAAPSAREPRS